MNDTLLVIDSYLSTQERYESCKNLIAQLKEVFQGHKILLINKHKNSYGIEEEVNHYFYYGDGFMVGYPPQNVLDNEKYEMPYTYVEVGPGTCENWFPLVGVTDHVAGIYNSFIISCRIAKMLGYDKIFKVEYDTSFDDTSELQRISEDVRNFKDYLFYGTRREGEWAKSHQYLVDVHMIGYSTRAFDMFELVKNDEDYWSLCDRIGYYGKWIEYVIPSVIEHRKKFTPLEGTDYPVRVAEMFPKTRFDIINSPGLWSSSWDVIPKVCRVGYSGGNQHTEDQIVLFYWGNEDYSVNTSITIKKDDGSEVYAKEVVVDPRTWILDNINISEPINVEITTTHIDQTYTSSQRLVPGDLRRNVFPRFLYK